MKSLQFEVDFRSGIPIYVQLVEQVQAFLASGALSPGDQLPTVRQLASELRVNFNTIARAYRLLDEAGLISTQQGRGTYLLDQPTEDAQRKIKQETLEIQIRRFLRTLQRQGYDQEDSRQIALKLFQAWQEGSLEKDNEIEN